MTQRIFFALVVCTALATIRCADDGEGGLGSIDASGFADLGPISSGAPDSTLGGTDNDATDPASAECTTNAQCKALYAEIDPCQVALCDGGLGKCILQARKDYETCDDQNLCIIGATCLNGICMGAQNVVCDDANPCTDNSCDPAVGCVFSPNSAPCDDGNPCTESDQCASGECTGGTSTCPCQNNGDCATFDDGNACNGVLVCGNNSTCVVAPGSVVVCTEPAVGCLTWECQPANGQCIKVPVPDGSECTDGNACTTGDSCKSGVCISTGVLNCDTDSACAKGVCKADKGCETTMLSGPCDDGNPCTVGDKCADGVCQGAGNTCVCSNDEDCFIGGVEDKCAGTLMCVDSGCVVKPGTAVSCAQPADPCLESVCQPPTGECATMQKKNGSMCNDSDPCTAGDTCIEGLCKGAPVAGCGGCSTAADCDDGDPCTIDVCGAGGNCSYSTAPECVPECVTNADCDDNNPCVTNTCSAAGKCSHVSNTSPCSDGNACTGPDFCSGGSCTGGPAISCNNGNPCTVDSCNPASGCVHTEVGGECCTNDAQCNDNFACTKDLCTNNKCSNVPITCTAPNACTLSYCQQGVCVNTPAGVGSAGLVVFSENFDDNVAQGWKLTSKNTETYFSIQSKRSFSPPSSLYGGKPSAWSYDFGISDMLASLPAVNLPKGQITLRFRYWTELQQPSCFADVIYVGVNGKALQPFVCESSGGQFQLREYDISEYAGTVAFISFFFQTYNDLLNAGEGVYLDDIQIIAKPSANCQ